VTAGLDRAPREQRTWCRICPAQCGVIVTVSDGQPVKVVGDRDDPLSRGYVCQKGRRMVGLANDPRRLDQPMMRDDDGRLVAVDWETLLDDLGDRLAEIRDQRGAGAIASYTGTMYDAAGRVAGTRLMAALGSRSVYTSLTVDAIAKVLVTKLMSGHERPWPQVDYDETTLLVIVGENVVVSHGGYSYLPDPIRHLRRVTERGELWVVDPRTTATALLAHRHLVPRSGSDFALFGHLVREILRTGSDEAHLAAHATHVDELRAAVEPFDLGTTTRLTGLDAGDLGDLLAAIRRHRRFALVTGTGVSMADTGNVAEWLAMALQIITGSFERTGGRWFNHGAAFDPERPPAPDFDLGPGPPTRPDLARLAGQYPSAVLPSEIEAGNVGAVLVQGGNPLTAFPQPERVAAALDRLDVLAVWDIVETPVTDRATHVLPCPDPLERAELRLPIHVPAVFAQYSPPVVPRHPGRRSMWWSLAELGERLGASILPADRNGDGPDDWSDDDVLAAQLAGTMVDFETLRAADGRPVAFPRVDRWVETRLLPDQRWDLAPQPLVDQLGSALERPTYDLVLGNRREVAHVNSLFTWTSNGDPLDATVQAHPDDVAALGLVTGDRVEVRSPHGSLVGTLEVTTTVGRGIVSVPHGYGALNVGALTAMDEGLDPITGMPTLVGIPLTLTAVQA